MVEWVRKARLFPGQLSTEGTAASIPASISRDLNLEVCGCWENLTT